MPGMAPPGAARQGKGTTGAMVAGGFDSRRSAHGRAERDCVRRVGQGHRRARLGRARRGRARQGHHEGRPMEPFKPSGEQPKWRPIYDLALTRAPDDLITYDELEQALGYDVTSPGASRSPIYAASKRLLNEHDRALVADPTKGYRI